MTTPIVIVGASHTGAALADALHREKWTDGIMLIGDEETLPYHRPPLSKEFLSGGMDEDRLPIRDADFFSGRGHRSASRPPGDLDRSRWKNHHHRRW